MSLSTLVTDGFGDDDRWEFGDLVSVSLPGGRTFTANVVGDPLFGPSGLRRVPVLPTTTGTTLNVSEFHIRHLR